MKILGPTLFVILIGCSSSEEPHPQFLGGGVKPEPVVPPCRSGEIRPCTYTDDVTLNDGGLNGGSTCIDGVWGSCRSLGDGGSNESG